MIVIDYIFLIYSPLYFLPFLSYLFIKKRNILLYIIYGLLLDYIFMNPFLINFLFMLIMYFKLPKRRRKKKNIYYYFIAFIFILVVNICFHGSIFLIFDSYYIFGIFLNLTYFLLCNKYLFSKI